MGVSVSLSGHYIRWKCLPDLSNRKAWRPPGMVGDNLVWFPLHRENGGGLGTQKGTQWGLNVKAFQPWGQKLA